VKYGEFSRRPYLDIRIPSLADPSLAPGKHVMTITVKYAPYHLGGGWDGSLVSTGSTDAPANREAFTDTVLDTLAEYAPNIREKIVASKLLTPCDLEREFGLPEGNINHGEMTLDQFFHMRPVPGWAGYRSLVQGVYLCGSGTHPGGGVTGIPGRNSAREIIRDRGERR
jgi:phytoene dehydrogenase-like protein